MTKTNGTNGTKNNDGVREQLGAMLIDDLVDASVLSLFFVQKLGKASASDVGERIKDNDGVINEHLLDQALEALRGRGLLSYARGAKRSGESVKMYKTTKVKWASPPEVAHIKDLLPELVKTEEAGRIINILNGAEEIGDGQKKSKRKLGYAEYWEIELHFRLLNPILGSQPDSPWLRKTVKSSKVKAPAECDLRFWRDDITGQPMIPSDVVAGWLRTGIRVGLSKSDVVAKYIAADDILLDVKEVYQTALPIIVDNKGAGIGTYELIPAGTKISTRIRIPARGIADPMSFVLWIASYAPKPLRGLSPARGRRFGKMELVDYKILGSSDVAEKALDAVMPDLKSDEAKKLYAELFATAAKNKVNFGKVDKGGFKASDIKN